MRQLSVIERHVGGFEIVEVHGAVGVHNGDDLSARFDDWINHEKIRIILDLRDALLYEAVGLGIIVHAAKKIAAKNGTLILVFQEDSHISERLRWTQLDTALPHAIKNDLLLIEEADVESLVAQKRLRAI
jgi:anti-anti-sigma factor